MWKYAEVETIASQVKFITETKFITNFDTYTQATKGKVYIVKQAGKSLRCLILKTANSIKDIDNPCVRSRRPKVNPSSIEEKSSDSDESIDLLKAQRKRKAKGQNLAQTKKIMSQEILTAYAQQRINNDDNSKAMVDENDDEVITHSSHDEINEEEDYDNESEHDSDRDKITDTIEHDGSGDASKGAIGNENDGETIDDDLVSRIVVDKPLNSDGHLAEKIHLSDNHNDMKRTNGTHCEPGNDDHNKHLEEKRRRRLKELKLKQLHRHRERESREREHQDQEGLQREQQEREHREREHRDRERLQREQREREQREQREQEQREREQRDRERLQREREQREREQRERGDRERAQREQREQEHRDRERLRGNQIDANENDITNPVHIGGQIFIPSLSYTEAFREYRPSKFITIMSHAIWGYGTLASRAVKVMRRNRNKLPLTPTKKVALERQYAKFLQKRNLSAEMQTVERNKINTYLGRSISSAKKKVANTQQEESLSE